MNHYRSNPLRGVRTIEMIEIKIAEGAGTEDDPVRVVRYYYTKDGVLKARYDSAEDSVRSVENEP